MAWVAPITWTTGQIVSAANLNEQIRDNSTFLHDFYMPLAGGTMTGQLVAAAGTVGAPGIALAGSLTTGFYRPAADQIAVAIAGAQAHLITASTTTITPQLVINGASGTYDPLYLHRALNTADAAVGVQFRLLDSISANTIYAAIYGCIEDNTNGSEDGYLRFDTTLAGVTAERMRITSAGNATFTGIVTANGFTINNTGAGSDPSFASNAATQALTLTGLLGIAMTPVRTLDVTGTFGTTGAGTIGGLLTASTDVNITGSAASALYALQVLVSTTKTDQGAGASVYGISVGGGGGGLQKTASTGNLYGMYMSVNFTVDVTKTCDRAAQLALNGITATVNGTLTNHNALYLGVPVNGSTAQIIGTAVAGCFLTTVGVFTSASHELTPDGRKWKLNRPERLSTLDPLGLVRAIKVHAYDVTDAWFEEEREETVIDWEDDPETGLSVPRQRVERKRRYWQAAEHDRGNHIGYFAEELHQLNPMLCRDGLGLNPLAICAVHTLAIQELTQRDDQRKRSLDDLWAENRQLKDEKEQLQLRVAALEAKIG